MTIEDNIKNQLPFISVISYGGNEYAGIVINQNQYVTSMYDLSSIKTSEERTAFIEYGEVWWWESNRKIPINIFLSKEMTEFQYAIKTFSTKDVALLFGPMINLNEVSRKRVKRTSIKLVKKIS